MQQLEHPLDWRAIQEARAHARLGRHVVYKPSVESTSLLARALLRAGVADGTVVLTDEQTRGRGRLGRQWLTPPRSGLTVSIILRLPDGFALYSLTPVVALTLGDVVGALVGERCTLKWPNDVLVDGLKVGGILVDLDVDGDNWAAVVGVGLNVNAAPALPTAACLAAATGHPLAREPLLVGLLGSLEGYLDGAARPPRVVMRAWRDRLDTLGRHVRVQTADAVVEGLAVDVDDEGALLVRRPDGALQPVRAGDVTLASPSSLCPLSDAAATDFLARERGGPR